MKKTFFQRVGTTRIIPISLKLVGIFVSLLLLSNFATNFLTLQFTKRQLFLMTNTIMTNQLKDMYTTAGNQYQIYTFTKDRVASINAIKQASSREFTLPHSRALAFDKDGVLLFSAGASAVGDMTAATSSADDAAAVQLFSDSTALALLNERAANGITDGSLTFTTSEGQYFGVYKYQSDWKCYFVRAELRSDTIRSTLIVLGIISVAIIVLVLGFLTAGLFMFRHILGNVKRITDSLYTMQQEQHLSLIDLSNAPNDDVTYLAASFNSLSATINNLLGMFQKFVSKDVVAKAYREHEIRLEGSRRNLTMLFSDIKSFTYRTETLGTDIIDLLNVHYDRVIHTVHENDGVIGSIIGDAILAIYGATDERESHEKTGGKHSQALKSLAAVDSAWGITRATADLRQKMIQRRAELGRELTEAEERVYQAVLIDVGVGIDGGTVFYGNIGSDEHMTNTVIGDNVNAASRLEGLTRIYKLPVIVSEYIKTECEKASDRYEFFEIDTVQVKGKTEGVKIYLPLEKDTAVAAAADATDTRPATDSASAVPAYPRSAFEPFERGLSAYYAGDWTEARKAFKSCPLEVAQVFLDRIGTKKAPEDWNGIWTMTTK